MFSTRYMICMISPAKTFAKKISDTEGLAPVMHPETLQVAEQALRMDGVALSRELKLSPKMATEARQAWLAWTDGLAPEAPALSYYSGMVFRKIEPASFTPEDWAYAEEHLRICSFVYGLLSPRTLIRPYRMEGTVRLEDGQRVSELWRPRLTEELIRLGQQRAGVLIHLASAEMEGLYDWAEVKRQLRVVDIHFEVRQADGSLKSITVYCKMARGAMMREIIKQRIDSPEGLKALTPEGFVYQPELSDEHCYRYVLG